MIMNRFYKIIFYVSICIFVMGMCCINLTPDNDLWARLIAGAHIVEKLSVLKYDFLSYTPTHPWYDHEWGASVFLYGALKYFGDSGLIFLKGILAALTIFICIKTVELRQPKSTTPYNIFYYAMMFWAIGHSLGSITRCLMFTCLFFALFLYLLEYSRIKSPKSLIFLPLIMLFWSNIHGGCMAGLGLIGLYIAGEFLNKKPVKYYIICLAVCTAVLFINPYGFEYVKFLFFAALMNRELITEWQSSFHPALTFRYINYKIFLILMLFSQIMYFIKIKYKEIDKTKLIVVIFVTLLSILKVRHQAFFVIAAGTLLYDEFYSVFNQAFNFIREKLKLTENAKNIIIYAILLSLSVPLLFFKSKQIRITETEYPRFAIEFIQINNLKGNLFVNFNWGSYAAYKLYPNNLIVMDGRYEEVYYPVLLEEMRDFFMLRNEWNKIIKDYKADVMLIEKKYPVYNKIKDDKNWALVFENNLSGVFVPIETVREEYIYPQVKDEYYNSTKFDTNIKF